MSTRNPLNIGAAARAMSNMGFRRLRVVNPYNVAFREARSAVGAGSILAEAEQFGTLAEAVADCSLVVGTSSVSERGLRHPLRQLEYGGRLLRKHLVAEPAALVFGSEKCGLSNEHLAHCNWLLRIPTRREHPSMNLGQAVAVCLYELVRSPRAVTARPKSARGASAASLERLNEMLAEVLLESGYVKPGTAPSIVRKNRRLLRRLQVNAADAELLVGMLRQIRWKLDN